MCLLLAAVVAACLFGLPPYSFVDVYPVFPLSLWVDRKPTLPHDIFPPANLLHIKSKKHSHLLYD